MNKGFIAAIAFTTGGVIGFVTANKCLKQHYEQIVQEEVDSVKRAFKRHNSESTTKTKKEEKSSEENSSEKEKTRYRRYVEKLGYANEEERNEVLKPRVISPDEFGSINEYEQISLTYYADGTVADDDDYAMDDREIEKTIGRDSLNHFGEYEDDSVFVRNDNFKVDYEILMDSRTYKEILEEKPFLKLKR